MKEYRSGKNTREERREMLLVRFVSGARFFARETFPALWFSVDDADAWRFAKDDVVEEENDERRFDISIKF